MNTRIAVVAMALLTTVGTREPLAQTTPLLPTAYFESIRSEASGELPLVDFRHIYSSYTGFSPSRGGDQTAEYLARRMREYGLSQVTVEGFPADGKTFFWTFLTEPAWDPEVGTLMMVEPRRDRIADFAVHRVVLGRFSSSADVRTELLDVGTGTTAAEYAGKDVKGKIVLASGNPGLAHEMAVWQHGAAGIVWYRTFDPREFPHLVSNPGIQPWFGPKGEPPGFAFAVSYQTASDLRAMLGRGERVVLHAVVKATTGTGEYKLASAAIPGTDPSLPEVWVWAHSNYRNTGGANNLTGVGATIEVARVLRTLVDRGALPRPRRTIRFYWGAEHYASVYNFYKHPERRERVLSMLNVDMTGFHQERAKAVFRLYRLPHSLPHFLSDVAEEFMHAVGRANTISIRNAGPISQPGPGFYDPVFAPTGSRDQLHYAIEEFWGPSDHEDVAEASLGVPAVLYNDWPDPWLGTQEDDINKVDPTQMRRSIITVAATAYYLASATPEQLPLLASVVTASAQARMAREAARAVALVETSRGDALEAAHREAMNILTQSMRREVATIESLRTMGATDDIVRAIARSRRQIEAQHETHLAAYKEQVAAVAAPRKLTLREPQLSATERRIASLVPRRNDALKGPVNLFRPDYGLTWMQEKMRGADFRSKVALFARGHYVLYEALNFADGRRTLMDIRDALSAEYGPVDLVHVEEYFRLLERAGVVSIGSTSSEGNPR